MTDFSGQIREANERGWFLLNCFQAADVFRVSLAHKAQNGSKEHYATEYADGETPDDALSAAWKNAQTRMNMAAKHRADLPLARGVTSRDNGRGRNELTPQQEARLAKLIDAAWYALKLNGAGSRNREADL